MARNTIELQALLNRYHIATDRWGSGSAKTLRHLMTEVETGETLLRETATGLLRETAILYVEVLYEQDGHRLRLIEHSQEFADGRVRRRDYLPASLAEKTTVERTRSLASLTDEARRAVREELGLEVAEQRFVYLQQDETLEDSPSYPGLLSRFMNFFFSLHLGDDEYRDEYREIQPDKVTIFRWVPF